MKTAINKGPVLLLGGNGMLGTAFCRLLEQRGIEFEAPSQETCDFTQPASIDGAVEGHHSLVINAAAYTDVDGCEKEEPLARQVNALAPGRLARRCTETGAKLIHFSTDYVFRGDESISYSTDVLRNPLNAYGRTKAEGEALIEESGCDYLIVRTSWLYAPWGKNFVRTILRLAEQRDELRVVDDQCGRPTSSEHLAQAALQLASNGVDGTWHVTDGGQCTWYEFACEIVRQSGLSCEVRPCTTEEFPRPAPRPAYSVLDTSNSEVQLGPLPYWRENLKSVISQMKALAI